MFVRPTVRCEYCELKQFAAPNCRRCKQPLSKVDASTIFSELDTLPTLEEMKTQLIAEAVQRTRGDRREAARILGIGKTTVYRKAKVPEDRKVLGRPRVFKETFLSDLARAQVLDAEDYASDAIKSGRWGMKREGD